MFIVPTNTSKKLGAECEEKALEYFKKHGFKLLCRNYQCRMGEIDLILKAPDNSIIFLEVKFRSSNLYGSAQSFVDSRKQKKLIQTALFYIKKNQLQGSNFRFDVAAMTPNGIEHIPNAFSTAGYTL